MRTLLNILLTLTVLAGIVGFSEPAAAQEVTIRVRSIAASTQGQHFDSKLDDLKTKLQKAFRGYTHFELVDDTKFTLQANKSKTVAVPGGTEMTLEFKGVTGDFLRLGLSIGDKLHTTLKASRGSTFFQAGLSYKSGMLILAITAE